MIIQGDHNQRHTALIVAVVCGHVIGNVPQCGCTAILSQGLIVKLKILIHKDSEACRKIKLVTSLHGKPVMLEVKL